MHFFVPNQCTVHAFFWLKHHSMIMVTSSRGQKHLLNLICVTNFKWIQIVNAILTAWKSIVRNSPVNRDMCCSKQHLTINDKMVPTGMLSTRVFYDLYIDNISIKPTSQKYFERLFGLDLLWNKIYSIPHLVTVDTSTRYFQFKVSHNTLFLNARLVHLNYSTTPLCSLCENCNETPVHLFCECPVTVWSELKNFSALHWILTPSHHRVLCLDTLMITMPNI